MNLPIDQYPTEGSSNENVLFASLGSFWTQVFDDQAALHGLTIAQAEEIFQDYYRLLESVNSFSSNQIAVFNTVKWLPLMIKKSELNSNVLIFGEQVNNTNVLFDDPDQTYIFGAAMPEDTNVYVAPLPADLQEVSIITNRVISPTFVLVNNLDIKIYENHLYFYGNPFNLANIATFNLLDATGKQVYYNNPLTGQPIPDQMLVLWAYNGKIDTDALKFNIAYLFGINLPSSKQSKDILDATVKLFSVGPTVYQLKAICCAFLGIKPIVEEQEIVQNTFEITDEATVLVTDKHVYRYPIYYTLDPTIQVGSTLSLGDVPVDAVEYYDNLVYRNWWLNKIIPKISVETNAVIQSPSMVIPASMFVGSYKYGLIFDNTLELIVRASDGTITFPVNGHPDDVAAFQAQINLDPDAVATAVGGLAAGTALLINPLDFLFNSFFRNNAAMLKVNFQTLDQLSFFTQYFSTIKDCLPKHVFFTFFFDTPVPGDIYSDAALDTFPAWTAWTTYTSYTGSTSSLDSLRDHPELKDGPIGYTGHNLKSGGGGAPSTGYTYYTITIPYGTTSLGYSGITIQSLQTGRIGGNEACYVGMNSYPTGATGPSNNAMIEHNILVWPVPTIYYGITGFMHYTAWTGATGAPESLRSGPARGEHRLGSTGASGMTGYLVYSEYTGFTGWTGANSTKITNKDYNFLEVMQSP